MLYIWGTVVSGMTPYVWWWSPRWSSKRRFLLFIWRGWLPEKILLNPVAAKASYHTALAWLITRQSWREWMFFLYWNITHFIAALSLEITLKDKMYKMYILNYLDIKILTAVEARFLTNTPVQDGPFDFRLPPNADSARSQHSLFCVSCYQNHHRQNINLYVFRTAQTANLSSQAWQDIGCYNRSKNPNLKTGTLVSLQSKILFLGVPSVSSHMKSIRNKGCYY
jgi:hypothetical protein